VNVVHVDEDADLERRFGGLRRLYGDADYGRIRRARVAVVGLGGVGSWAVEALARSGVAELVLFDLDQVAESNIHRQVQALGRTVGQAKTQALTDRIADIHPGCRVQAVEDFVQPDNWPQLLPSPVDVLIDACDQVQAKLVLASWALVNQVPLICVGAAGGKRHGHRVAVEDLAQVTHDPLLASLRQRLRKTGQAARQGNMGLRCVFSNEPVLRPSPTDGDGGSPGAPLACAGYGSTVTVTATFGLVAAGEALELHLMRARS
jgi:tRNA threonylcarbamoyladenosine dehydratase